MTAEDFVRNGIYSSKSLAVRMAYKQSFELLSMSFSKKDGPQPLTFILGVLNSNFPV